MGSEALSLDLDHPVSPGALGVGCLCDLPGKFGLSQHVGFSHLSFCRLCCLRFIWYVLRVTCDRLRITIRHSLHGIACPRDSSLPSLLDRVSVSSRRYLDKPVQSYPLASFPGDVWATDLCLSCLCLWSSSTRWSKARQGGKVDAGCGSSRFWFVVTWAWCGSRADLVGDCPPTWGNGVFGGLVAWSAHSGFGECGRCP